jgi:transcription antitermination factor NusG
MVLRNKEYEEFLPLYRSRRVWSDRIAQIEIPLFPGYIFCRFDPTTRRMPLITTPGVIQIVGIAGTPAPIDNQEISALHAIINSGAAAQSWPYLRTGNRVRIDYGSLAGVEGMLIEVKKQHRLVVSVTLLQRSVAVELERDWVIPCKPVSRASPPQYQY